MEKIQLTGQNLGQVFNSRSDPTCAMHFHPYEAKRTNLKLKTQRNELLGYLSLGIMLTDYIMTVIAHPTSKFSQNRFPI